MELCIESMLTRGNVELPPVPGASHQATGKRTFAKRAALMWANSVKREKGALDIEQRNDPVGDDNFQ